MTDLPEHNPGDHEDPLPGPTWTVGIAGMVLLAVSVLVVAAAFYSTWDREQDVKVRSVPAVDLVRLEATQLARLAGPVRIELRTADEESLVIPIDRAMEAVVQDMGQE